MSNDRTFYGLGRDAIGIWTGRKFVLSRGFRTELS
jgi:hypothetical protein